MYISDLCKKINFFFFQKLYLIDNDSIAIEQIRVKIPNEILYKITLCLKTNARYNTIMSIADIGFWFEENRFLSFFEIIVSNHESIGSLGTSHSSIAEIEFCHILVD